MELQVEGSNVPCDPSTSTSGIDSSYYEVLSEDEDNYEEEDLHLYLSDSEEDTPRKTGEVLFSHTLLVYLLVGE